MTFEGEITEADAALTAHSVALVPCEVGDGQDADGYNKEQETKLRCRKRPSGQNEEDRWNEMYRILFSARCGSPIPSPCEFQCQFQVC
jgi:hypothetical protein